MVLIHLIELLTGSHRSSCFLGSSLESRAVLSDARGLFSFLLQHSITHSADLKFAPSHPHNNFKRKAAWRSVIQRHFWKAELGNYLQNLGKSFKKCMYIASWDTYFCDWQLIIFQKDVICHHRDLDMSAG